MISVVTSYPAGAAFSESVYLPSGRFLINVEVLPEVNFTPVPLYFSSSTASSPRTTSFLSITIALFSVSKPARISSAPTSSSEPSIFVLLIATSVLYGVGVFVGVGVSVGVAVGVAVGVLVGVGKRASFIVTMAGLPLLALVTYLTSPFTTPFSIVKMISVVTS